MTRREKDLITYYEVSEGLWTKDQMKGYIDKNFTDISPKTGKPIKVNTYKLNKRELRSIIINTLEQNIL